MNIRLSDIQERAKDMHGINMPLQDAKKIKDTVEDYTAICECCLATLNGEIEMYKKEYVNRNNF